MSLTRTSGPADEPGLYMDEAEAAAFRLAGGPSDTAKNPIQYFGNRGALAGHIDQVDKFIKRVPKPDGTANRHPFKIDVKIF